MVNPLSRRFTIFAESECRDSSPLYEHLALRIAEDEEMLALAGMSRPGQPLPNLFFAAVHFLLFEEIGASLAGYYPDLVSEAEVPPHEDVYPVFREFCFSRRDGILELIASRLVQTNEIRRGSYLAPAFTVASEQAAHRPLALIEVGTSAGLNLLWDRYGYRCRGRHGRSIVAGAVGSPAQIQCELRGEIALPGSDRQAEVFLRTGIDLRPLDLRDRTDLFRSRR